MKIYLSKYYTRIIGIFFLLVIISLISDYLNSGFREETMHKIFHVLLGIIILKYGWSNPRFQENFPIVNGLFFTYVALFGWIFPNFANLETFNLTDTILHSIVGLSGIVVAWIDKIK